MFEEERVLAKEERVRDEDNLLCRRHHLLRRGDGCLGLGDDRVRHGPECRRREDNLL